MNKQVIYVCGFLRSGNTWLARLLGDALDSPVDSQSIDAKENYAIADEGFDRTGSFVIRQQHLMTPKEKAQVVFIYRDPRDVAISTMYYWGRPSLDETLVIEYDKPPMILHPSGGWAAFMCQWMHIYEADATISYERLLANPVGEMQGILMELGIDPVNRLEDVAFRQSFKQKRASIENEDANMRPYGKTIQLKGMRKGIAGDWRNHFKRRHGELAHKHWWHWLDSLGYEDNVDWWKELAE